ncbi:Alpha-N-acetylgalactosamine-specific lectin [Holothuria leucospilota]|uniref:Alpha-N-acetylgalactosamine-specific lectin n=1 Tax=Holothuria leucospilota TaxID=206669 RepID=A0A9Q1CHK6_HOLLE|nr:Alpha-N-acetylgalactosamine-specific lectin [Holothuria leucospilota]
MLSVSLRLAFVLSTICILQCEAACETFWTEHNGKCYRYYGTPYMNWRGAEDNCIEQGGHLASILSKEDENFILEMWRSSRDEFHKEGMYPWKKEVSIVYIGLYAPQKDGNYIWSDGSDVTYTNWARDQPSNGVENSVLIWDWPNMEGTWNDVNENTKAILGPSICAKPEN